MTAALNHTTKALEQFSRYREEGSPLARIGFAYLADKLRQAQVFILPDGGSLLDRGKGRPEVPGMVFRPPFPVVALEYEVTKDWGDTVDMTVPCPKRIALAWDWRDDLPAGLREMSHPLGAGVCVASISHMRDGDMWLPVAVAAHMGYEDEWATPSGDQGPYVAAMLQSGQMPKARLKERTYPISMLPILPEVIFAVGASQGVQRMQQTMLADLRDEQAAYHDLCYALACGNVSTEEHPAPEKLNKRRIAAGRLPLKSFHILKLATGEGIEQHTGGGHGSPRPHLRRGHIRHLQHPRFGDKPRITWVNSSMVRPRGVGFVDKVYDMRGNG